MTTDAIELATVRGFKRYLSKSRRARWSTLGEAQRGWAEEVDPIVSAIVTTAAGGLTAASYSAIDFTAFTQMVWNRIVSIELPAAVFDKLINIATQGMTLGWSYEYIARRITIDLGWDVNVGYWDVQRQLAAEAIEARLAGLDPAAREIARLNDPTIAALQREQAEATKQAAREYSEWQYQAERIARTEAASAANFAALRQLELEGWTHKQWVSGLDDRVRDDHRAADGQVVPIGDFFTVGGYSMAMPGDYSAPAHEVIHCRCTVVGTMGEVLER